MTDEDLYTTIRYVSGTVSILGSSFILLSYAWIGARHYTNQLIVFLSISDFLASIRFLYGQPEDGSFLCHLQSWQSSYFDLVSISWTCCIAFSVLMIILQPHKAPSRFSFVFHLYCWTLPAILTIIPGALGYYGRSGAWCWITKGHEEWWWIQLYAYLILALLFIIGVYMVSLRLRKGQLERIRDNRRRSPSICRKDAIFIRKLVAYPAIFIIAWFFPFFNRVYSATYGSSVHWTLIAHSVLFPAWGMFNAIVYGVTERLKRQYRERWRFLTVQNRSLHSPHIAYEMAATSLRGSGRPLSTRVTINPSATNIREIVKASAAVEGAVQAVVTGE